MDNLLKFTDCDGNRCVVPIYAICGATERVEDTVTSVIITTIDGDEYRTSDITFEDVCNVLEEEEDEEDGTDYPEHYRS